MQKGARGFSTEVGERIAATRRALDLNQSELARRIESPPNKISQWESGTHLPSLPAAIALCDEFGVTLDWIFRGVKDGLPHALAMKIDAQLGKPAPAGARRPLSATASR
jgi:transcriptional regulator with XRE-family HTH domain